MLRESTTSRGLGVRFITAGPITKLFAWGGEDSGEFSGGREGGRSETFLKWVRSENTERHPKFPHSGNSRSSFVPEMKKNPTS